MDASTDDQSREAFTNGNSNMTEWPPSYMQTEAQPLELPILNLMKPLPPGHSSTVSPDQCIAHLKFLAVLADLRDTISTSEGLFGIYDAEADKFPAYLNEAKARIREKRWAVYTARAVDRYTQWWFNCVPSSHRECTMEDMEDKEHEFKLVNCTTLVSWNRDNLPPIDVLMVWHSHMLNPRNFIEDCVRYGKHSLWKTGFPWDSINRSINDHILEYTVNVAAQQKFQQCTHIKWTNLHDPPVKSIVCPRCKTENTVPWTQGGIGSQATEAFKDARGYADKGFLTSCTRCLFRIDHEQLKVAKFRRDLEDLLNHERPMPGSFINLNGLPQGPVDAAERLHRGMVFPSKLIKETGKDILSKTDARLDRCCKTISELRDELEPKLRDHKILKAMNGGDHPKTLWPAEKVQFRHMMSRYWDNLGPFALDLVGAVIRQGIFVQKMDKIDWLHSPTIWETANRIIKKYHIFFVQIMLKYPKKMAVPTLDVDLVWHTHQLAPSRYHEFSTEQNLRSHNRPVRILKGHDDKVEEHKLSKGFEWTSKMYRRATVGEIYSECTCWYCEATRAPDLYNRLFTVGSASRARDTADDMHDRADISSDPQRNPHISAHNAVPGHATKLQQMRLRRNYEKAVRRAEKRGQSRGDSKTLRDSDVDVLVWGYPTVVPYYGPYMADPCVNGYCYPCNPGCMSVGASCAAGTCTATVASGGCGGSGSAAGCAGSGGCGGGCGGGGGGGGCGGGCGGCG